MLHSQHPQHRSQLQGTPALRDPTRLLTSVDAHICACTQTLRNLLKRRDRHAGMHLIPAHWGGGRSRKTSVCGQPCLHRKYSASQSCTVRSYHIRAGAMVKTSRLCSLILYKAHSGSLRVLHNGPNSPFPSPHSFICSVFSCLFTESLGI